MASAATLEENSRAKMSPQAAFSEALEESGLNEQLVKIVQRRNQKGHYHVQMDVKKN